MRTRWQGCFQKPGQSECDPTADTRSKCRSASYGGRGAGHLARYRWILLRENAIVTDGAFSTVSRLTVLKE